MDALDRSSAAELDWLGGAGEALDVCETPSSCGARAWTDEEKALVVRECGWPGMRVGTVARRYGLSANQVNGWRSLARRGKLTLPILPATEADRASPAERTLAAGKAEPSFAVSRPAFAALEVEATPAGSVSIETRGVAVRLDGDISASRIAEIASALRGLR